MTIQKAIRARLRIEPGRKVRTFGGWCGRDRVLLDGFEIGKIQTRRGRRRTGVVTIAASGLVPGQHVDWLGLLAGEVAGCLAVSRVGRSRSKMDGRGVGLGRG